MISKDAAREKEIKLFEFVDSSNLDASGKMLANTIIAVAGLINDIGLEDGRQFILSIDSAESLIRERIMNR